MKKKKEVKITCQFCSHYLISNFISNGVKYCKSKKINVGPESPICTLFSPNLYVYCIRDNERISVSVCRRKFDKGYSCRNCEIGKVIKKIGE